MFGAHDPRPEENVSFQRSVKGLITDFRLSFNRSCLCFCQICQVDCCGEGGGGEVLIKRG